MGSYIEMNDTLQITKEQGFPKELDWKEHLKNPYTAEQFKDKIFDFKNKCNIRNYHMPPVRNFLVENIDGKWLYWGQIYILEINHDYQNKMTSGKFKIIYINKPNEMEMAHNLIDRNEDTFFPLNTLNYKFATEWLSKLKSYWFNKDVEGATSLFTKTNFYQETPFMKPYTTVEEIKQEWQHIKNEDIKEIKFDILAMDNNTLIAHWYLKQNNDIFDGIYEIRFNNNLECICFKSWEMEETK